jgi:hypothetical protein
MKAAESAGFQNIRLCTQKQFLLEQGVLGRLQGHSGLDPFSPEARANRAIRQLLLSDGINIRGVPRQLVTTVGRYLDRAADGYLVDDSRLVLRSPTNDAWICDLCSRQHLAPTAGGG